MRPPLGLVPVGNLSFLLFGSLLVLVGASQDVLRADLGLDLTETGLLASSVVAGIGVGVLAGGPLVDRVPRRPVFCAAATTTGVALCAVGAASSFSALASLLFLAGCGAGLYETVLNTAAVERYGERSARALAWMHSGATLGAVLTPVGLGLALAHTDWPVAFRALGASHLALALLALGASVGEPDRTPREAGRVFSTPLVLLCLAAFAYIGVEASLTAFAVPYAQDALALDADRGRGAISVFWLGLLAGRLAFVLFTGGESARPAAAAGAFACIAIALGVGLGWRQIELLLGAVGFAMGGVFPLLVALSGRWTRTAGAGVSLVAGLGSAGGFVVPWTTGLVGDAAGVASGIFTLALWSALFVIAASLADVTRRRALASRGDPRPAIR